MKAHQTELWLIANLGQAISLNTKWQARSKLQPGKRCHWPTLSTAKKGLEGFVESNKIKAQGYNPNSIRSKLIDADGNEFWGLTS